MLRKREREERRGEKGKLRQHIEGLLYDGGKKIFEAYLGKYSIYRR